MLQEVTKDDKEIVSAILKIVAGRVGQNRFDLWFATKGALVLGQESLHVQAADRFTLERIRKDFSADLKAACLEIVGRELSLEFTLGSGEIASANGHSPDSSSASPAAKKTDLKSRSASDSADSSALPPAHVAVLPNDAQGAENPTLQNFVVGSANLVAQTAIQSMLQNPGRVSPLCLHGPPGCGKTHLLRGMLHYWRRKYPKQQAVYLPAEQFTSLFLEALHGTGLPIFRRKYREVKLLLIDDLQFFMEKKATLLELVHTIESMLRRGCQVVLAADRSPAELKGLGQDLLNRLLGGLTCHVEPADFHARQEILRQMTQQRNLVLPAEVLAETAQQLPGDARLLRGAVNRLEAAHHGLQEPITLEFTQRVLHDLFQAGRPVIRLGDIEQAVCSVFGLEAQSLRSSRKAKDVNHPRMLAMWLARRYTRSAFSEIGKYFGGRRHSTVISAQKTVNGWVAEKATIEMSHSVCRVEEAIRRVEARLQSG